jgi:hypothetical protein
MSYIPKILVKSSFSVVNSASFWVKSSFSMAKSTQPWHLQVLVDFLKGFTQDIAPPVWEAVNGNGSRCNIWILMGY